MALYTGDYYIGDRADPVFPCFSLVQCKKFLKGMFIHHTIWLIVERLARSVALKMHI